MPQIDRESGFRTFIVLGLIVAIGIALRVTLVSTTDHTHLLRGDAYEYYRYALNLKYCGVYAASIESIIGDCDEAVPDSHRPPGFPLLLMPFAKWPPDATMIRHMQWTQIAIAAFGIALTFFAFGGPGRAVALTTALLVALSPQIVVTSLNILTENLFTVLLLVFVGVAAAWFRRRSLLLAAAVGVALALPLFVRPTTVYLVFLVLPFFVWSAERQRLLTGATILAAYLVCLAPWYVASHSYLPPRGGPSLSLKTIHNGTYIDLTVPGVAASRGKPHKHDPGYARRDTLGKVSAHLLARAAENPVAYLNWYVIGKPRMFFSWSVVAGFGDVFVYPVRYHGYGSNLWLFLSHEAMWYLHWPLILAALVVCFAVFMPNRGRYASDPSERGLLRLCAIIVAYFVAVHVVGTPLPRYSVPVLPLMFYLAVAGIGAFTRMLKPGPRV